MAEPERLLGARQPEGHADQPRRLRRPLFEHLALQQRVRPMPYATQHRAWCGGHQAAAADLLGRGHGLRPRVLGAFVVAAAPASSEERRPAAPRGGADFAAIFARGSTGGTERSSLCTVPAGGYGRWVPGRGCAPAGRLQPQVKRWGWTAGGSPAVAPEQCGAGAPSHPQGAWGLRGWSGWRRWLRWPSRRW